jgi:hypothetical protein
LELRKRQGNEQQALGPDRSVQSHDESRSDGWFMIFRAWLMA